MRKQFLFIAGAALLALASCQPNTNETAPDQAQIDSMVNARVEELRLEMLAQNDSLINALAIQKADSIVAAMKSGGSNTVTKSPTKKPPTKGTTNPEPTKPTEPTNTGKNTGEQGTNTGKNSGEQGTNTGKRR